jgi:hypothetical protein
VGMVQGCCQAAPAAAVNARARMALRMRCCVR